MRAKFEALCRKAQNDICKTIEELDGEGKVRIRRAYYCTLRVLVAEQVCMFCDACSTVHCDRPAMDMWPRAWHFAHEVDLRVVGNCPPVTFEIHYHRLLRYTITLEYVSSYTPPTSKVNMSSLTSTLSCLLLLYYGINGAWQLWRGLPFVRLEALLSVSAWVATI